MFRLRTVILFWLMLVGTAIAGLRHFVYQKDVSEFCRRRAVPSVFLGKYVMETNAEMLHFSKLDLPYSCYTSVRTESSSNIIMVVQLPSGSEVVKSCKEFENQLIVYEFGETFGGYWGPIPKAVIEQDLSSADTSKLYTLQTTGAPPTTLTEAAYESTEDTTETTTQTTWRQTENADFINIEVPLMNLTGRVVPGESKIEKSFDDDGTFDLLYDVAPRKGEKYDTSILPLMHFSLKRLTEGDGRRGGDGEVRYDLDYNLGTFTPDYRLTLPVLSTRSRMYRNRNLWRPKKLQRKHPKSTASNVALFKGGSRTFNKPKKNILPKSEARQSSYTQMESKGTTETEEIHSEESYKFIEDLIKSLNKSQDLIKQEPQLVRSYLPVMKNISVIRHNFSAYLVPWSTYTYLPASNEVVNLTKKHNISPLSGNTTTTLSINRLQETDYLYDKLNVTKIDSSSSERTPGKSESILNEENNKSSNALEATATHVISTKSFKLSESSTPNKLKDIKTIDTVRNTANSAFTASTETVNRSLSGSLLDHESWENVVLSAPVIADLLNHNRSYETPLSVANGNSEAATHKRIMRHLERGRRFIAPIPIELARPHAHPTSYAPVVTAHTLRVADVQQHFAQLVELPDDEMSQRVALRYMKQYAGPTMYNICERYEIEHKTRHVVLFNSSRIILAIGNFTMLQLGCLFVQISRMTVVLTTARTLRGSEPRCPDETVECQVGGTRVCIDSNSACDGVPNCGTHDIYDEDRLQCGGSVGLQHNVCLAAFTFLAVLLTLLYIVHYWLKRCVPRVADAFFVYTDGAENVLYLDTIMRSPTDFDTSSKHLYTGSIFEDSMYLYDDLKPPNFLYRLSTKFLKMIGVKQRRDSSNVTELDGLKEFATESRKMYSFTELELRNIGTLKKDEEVQTGQSLEMAFLKMVNLNKQDTQIKTKVTSNRTWRNSPVFSAEPQKYVNVERKSISVESTINSPGTGTIEEEKEIQCTLYDPQSVMNATGESSKTTGIISAALARKRLRFEKQTLLIPTEGKEDDDANETSTPRQSVLLGMGTSRQARRNINSMDTIQQDPEPAASDIRSFFMGKKIKKKKGQK